MNAVERMKAILKNRNISVARLERECGFSNGYIGQLRKGTFPNDRLKTICDYLAVTPSYLMGYTPDTECQVCHQHYDPCNEYQSIDHDNYHKRFVEAQNKYGMLMPYADADRGREDAIKSFRNKQLEDSVRVDAYDEYLRCAFIREVYKSGLDSNLDFDDYARDEADKLHPDTEVNTNIVNIIREKYGLPQLYTSQPGATYYDDDEARELANFLKENPEYRTLFDAARKVKPADIVFVRDMIERLKG